MPHITTAKVPDLIERFRLEYDAKRHDAQWRGILEDMADMAERLEHKRLSYLLDTCSLAPDRETAVAIMAIRLETIVRVLEL